MMRFPILRSLATAAGWLLLSYVPCLAQPPQVRPPDDPPSVKGSVPTLQVLPENPARRTDDALPDSAIQRVQYTDPIAQFWELLSEDPAPHHGNNGNFGPSSTLSPMYRVTWLPEAGVVGQGTNLTVVRQDFSIGVPLWKDECSMVGLTASVRNELFSTRAVLPGTNQAFPDELWDVRFGLNYTYKFANGWSTGATVSFGSASDRPFGSINELTASVMGFLRIPVGEHNAWLFSLMYSPTGELNFPIPGVAFYWQPSDTFNATIGIPTKIWWRPVEDLTLELSYMPLTTVKAKATYHLWGGVSVYSAFDMGNESYYLYNRADHNDRFFYYDERVTGGLKLEFGRQCVLDLSGGYAFDRHYFEGHSFSDSHNHRVDVNDGPFLSVMFEWRF